MSSKNLKLSLLLAVVAGLTTACSLTTTSTGNAGVESSVFLSTNSGSTWHSMTAVPTTGNQPGSISDLNVNTMVMDPEDSLAVYLASVDQGLYYTYNITTGWNKVAGLPTATINDVKVDPKNKCLIYAAVTNRLYRSNDCARTWTQVYFDNNTGVAVTTLVIDHYNPRNLYIGTSRGEIIKSIDSGGSWRTIRRLEEGVAQLIMSPLDSRLIFMATAKNHIFSFTSTSDTVASTTDPAKNFAVQNWTDLNVVLKDYNLGANFKNIVTGPRDGIIYLATNKVILRSPDEGITWENIKLLQPEKDAVINALAVNPQNSREVYYVTNTTFFHSLDGGVTWQTKSLPTKRAGRVLLVDFDHPNNIYLGTVKLK